ncbi:MAG: hypothetical protein AAGD25_12700 [Cyanobacteria bacterium P01_F01_bin.150]
MQKTFEANGDLIVYAWDNGRYLGKRVYDFHRKLVSGTGDFFRGIGNTIVSIIDRIF